MLTSSALLFINNTRTTNELTQNDLLKRLKNITEHLSEEDVEPHSPHYPGLSSLATSLVSVHDDDDTSYIYLNHKDKDVRLHSVLACMELFYIYAPEPPWNEDEIIEIFQQMIRQLGNLATCIPNDTSVTNQVHQYEAYFRILEQLSEVKIGVVLVDLVRTEQAPHALETLCELIKTILTCVHVDHPPEVGQHAESAVAACVEEFEGNIPNPVLDELLLPVGSGPVTYVIDPKSKENPPAQIQQTNPSYLVAAKVLRKTEDKISSPIANLLNGIFSGDPKTLESTSLSAQDSTESPPSSGKKKKKGGKDNTSSPTLLHFTKEVGAGDVYSIAYELHRITPMILTTVIGTVASDLTNTDVDKRWQATKLLGRLFAARTSDIAKRFGPCFRDWLRRSYGKLFFNTLIAAYWLDAATLIILFLISPSPDPEGAIREMMIRSLTNFLSSQYNQTELCKDVSEALSVIIKLDKITEIRVYAIHQVCELAHSATSDAESSEMGEANRRATHPISAVSAELLNAVGARVSSKFKTERKDAITGLARIYYKHYVTKKLQYVQAGGENVEIDEILDVLSKENVDKVLEEKFSWIPQKVFESVFFSDEQDPDLRSRIFQIVDDIMLGTVKKEGAMLSPTSRAVGLAMIMQSLQTKESANKWMCTLFSHRSNLQRSLGAYLDARSKAKECESGSAEAFTADAEAMEKLEKMAALCAPPPAAGKPTEVADLETVLRKFHAAKDKHIFRILSTIATPTHSPSARLRALDELPKRTKSLGNATSSWVRSLARRCAMGSFINSESIEHCIILSQECFEAGDCEAASHFLRCVKMATSIFPSLGGTKVGFENLAEFFDLSRTTVMTAAMKKDMEKFGIVTMISDILAKSASSRTGKKEKDTDSVDTLREQLHRTCTREGTPEQARNAVYAIAAMMNPRSKPITDLSVRARKEKNEFEPILKALVNPSRLSIPDDDANPKTKDRIISVLTAITAIAECAPYAFNASGEGNKLGWGERAIKFALDSALLGRNTRLDTSRDDGDDSEGSDSDEESPEKSGRKKTKGKKTGVSVHCQMMCEAIELLVTRIRSTIVSARRSAKNAELNPPSSTHIAEVFSTLAKILEDGGVPPSSVNGRYCKTSLDRAALRRSAAINLLRLCDSGLKLEDTYLTSRMWHVLSNVFLDDEASVRDAMAEELSFMLSGTGKYRHGGVGSAPSMQFIAFVTLCAESRKAGKVKTAMMQCISSLRGSIAQCQAQVRAMGKAAEKNFENNLKKKLMPECCVPYALHLLAFRQETASAAGTLAGEDDSDIEMETDELAQTEEASEKRLKKRLKFLFDPLIQSLGERADNVSIV
jgi:sister-chromatid-cohesion protein PDS5